MKNARASSAVVWAFWLLILLLELATPPEIVLGILYEVPLLLGASKRTTAQAWRFLMICCSVANDADYLASMITQRLQRRDASQERLECTALLGS